MAAYKVNFLVIAPLNKGIEIENKIENNLTAN